MELIYYYSFEEITETEKYDYYDAIYFKKQ